MAKLLSFTMLIAIRAKKLHDAISKAYAKLLTCNKRDKFFEISSILFIQNLNQNIFHNEFIIL